MFAVTFVGERRDNVVANLVFGLCLGFAEIGTPLAMVPFPWRKMRRIDPSSVPPGCSALLVPYWISEALWDMNFSELRSLRPEIRIGTLTGTSPFWPNCPTVDCRADGFHLGSSSLDGLQRENFAAIDRFLVIKARPDVSPIAVTEVGMGRLPELACGPRSRTPFVILDFCKRGWDEGPYRDAARGLAALMRSFPDLKVLVLGANPLERELLPRTDQVVRLETGRIQFGRLARLWARAWATVCHNESFGYSLVENGLSGTRVFASPMAQLPVWHQPEPLDALPDHLARWRALSPRDRRREAAALARRYEYEHPELCSWSNTAHRIVAAFSNLTSDATTVQTR